VIRFILNDKIISSDLPGGTVLVDLLRYHQQLTGTKIGCREGDCGACTVLVGSMQNGELRYESVTSCLMALGNANGKHIVTIEGINPVWTGEGTPPLNPIQQAMADEGATQCGFCTPGFVMSLAGFCLSDKEHTYKNAIAAIDGNICRCTGYKSIERAAEKLTALMQERNGEPAYKYAAAKKILPGYFASVPSRLLALQNGQTGDSVQNSKKKDPDVIILGGGTDLYVQKHDAMTTANIRYTFDQTDMKNISMSGDRCVLGSSVTVTDLASSPIIQKAFPAFDKYAKLISSTPIRNMGTLAGNFVNASPIGDLSIIFLALDAEISLSTPDNGRTRRLLLNSFYKAYKELDKKPGEFISEISFSSPGANTLFHFEKVSKRTHLDIASVNSAIRLVIKDGKIEDASVSAGGVGPVPLYLKKTSSFLAGKNVSEELVGELARISLSEISPISDARGSKEYKSLLLGQLIRAHFIELFPGLNAEKVLRTSIL
jgi:xanthine dehydrogenase small subunit